MNYTKNPEGPSREPTPSQGVNVWKPGSPKPPERLSESTIQRIRDTLDKPIAPSPSKNQKK